MGSAMAGAWGWSVWIGKARGFSHVDGAISAEHVFWNIHVLVIWLCGIQLHTLIFMQALFMDHTSVLIHVLCFCVCILFKWEG